MPIIKLKHNEEIICPSCGGPCYAGDTVYVDPREPDAASWCSKRCYDHDEIWAEQMEEEG